MPLCIGHSLTATVHTVCDFFPIATDKLSHLFLKNCILLLQICIFGLFIRSSYRVPKHQYSYVCIRKFIIRESGSLLLRMVYNNKHENLVTYILSVVRHLSLVRTSGCVYIDKIWTVEALMIRNSCLAQI